MTKATRRRRLRVVAATGSAFALGVGVLVTVGLTAGVPRAAANPSGASPTVYVTGSTGVATVALGNIQRGGASASAVSGIPTGLQPSGPTAVNATATKAVVGLETHISVAANTYFVGVIAIDVAAGTGTVTGTVQLPAACVPVGFAMDPTNPDTAYVLETGCGGNGNGGIQRLGIGVSPPTATSLPNDFGRIIAPTSIVISPDGQTLYVSGGNSKLRGIEEITSSGVVTNQMLTGAGPIADLAIAPNGTQLFGVAPNVVFSLNLPLTAGETPLNHAIKDPSAPKAVTVNPNDQTVYVGGNSGASPSSLVAFTTGLAQTGARNLPLGLNANDAGGLEGIAVSPDQSTLVVYGLTPTGGTPVIYPVSLPNLVVGPGTTLTGFTATTGPEDIAMTPDQAPAARFTGSIAQAGAATSFDASTSSVVYGSVTSFAWNFGDGTSTTTGSPTVSHTYAAVGTYTVTLTETDSAGTSIPPAVGGTSFAVDGPGQTAFRRADSSAQTAQNVVIPLTPPPATTTTTANSTTTTPGHHVTTTLPGKHVPGTPTLVLNPAVGPPGTIVTVTGSGFPPNAPVTISWSVSTGSVVVTANAKGKLPPSDLYILTPDLLGPRFAQSSGAHQATAPFLVVPGTSEPGGDDASLLFRSEGS